jgi:hypothetical protein
MLTRAAKSTAATSRPLRTLSFMHSPLPLAPYARRSAKAEC